jgi:hypothetical protein
MSNHHSHDSHDNQIPRNPGAVALAFALLAGACATDEGTEPLAEFAAGEGDVEDELEDEDEDERVSPPVVPLAVIEDDSGRVEWLPPVLPGDEPEVVITVRGLATPLILPDLVERIGPVGAYLALVDEDQPLDPELSPFVRDDDRALVTDRAQRQALRAENLRMQHDFELALDYGSDPQASAHGCTNAQRIHARNFYGAAYSAGGGSSGSRTCGQSMAFHSVDGRTYYCNIPNSDCDYELGGGVGGQCDPNGCTTVRGRTRALRARMHTYAGGGAAFGHYGARYRFGFKNCSNTYNAVMRFRRGTGAWQQRTIEPNYMDVRVGGNPYPPPHALARTFVAWGLWRERRNWGTSASPFNRVEMIAQTEGFLCGDIIQRFDTFELYWSGCNGGKTLCDGNNCKGEFLEAGCWN